MHLTLNKRIFILCTSMRQLEEDLKMHIHNFHHYKKINKIILRISGEGLKEEGKLYLKSNIHFVYLSLWYSKRLMKIWFLEMKSKV